MSRGSLPGLVTSVTCVLLLALWPASALAQTNAAPAQPYRTPTAAEDNEARELFKIGKEAFDEGRFERALKYFNEAYELSHRPALLSNIGTALDRLRRDQEAVDAYRKYLEQVPAAPNRAMVEDRIRIIEAALARSQVAPPLPAAAPATPPSAAAPVTPTSQPGSGAPARSEPAAPSPQEAALAAPSSQSPVAARADQRLQDTGATPVTQRWWFWTGIGAAAVAAVVIVVAVSAGGSSNESGKPRTPILLDPTTRVREL